MAGIELGFEPRRGGVIDCVRIPQPPPPLPKYLGVPPLTLAG